jgi:hypothetical protein
VLPPVRSSFPSASGGLRVLGCVGERWFSARRCRVGPRVSRVRFPVKSSRWRWRRRQGIRSCRALPCLDGVSLRRHQRSRGGGASCVEPLYRSSPATCRPCWEVCLPAFCSVDAETTLDLGVAWRVEQTCLPAVIPVVVGEFGSKVVGAWGVSPTDGLSALSSSRS